MRILVVGKKQSMHWPENVAKFLPAEHNCCLFLYNALTLHSVVDKVLKRHRWKNRAQLFKRKVLEFKPDIIFFVSAFFVPQEFYDVAASFKNIIKVGWTGDAFGLGVAEKANVLDILFCSDTGFLPIAKNFLCATQYLPLCADETVFCNLDLPHTKAPFFVGDSNPVRVEYLSALQTHFEIYGIHWPKHKLKQHSVHNRRLEYDRVNKFYNTSIAPINLNFSRNGINGLNFRVFEIGATGRLIIVNEQEDLKLCYEIDKECVVYHTPEELDALLQDIAQDPLKYQSIAKNGFLRTLKEHTYTKRLEQALVEIEQLVQKRGNFLES